MSTARFQKVDQSKPFIVIVVVEIKANQNVINLFFAAHCNCKTFLNSLRLSGNPGSSG